MQTTFKYDIEGFSNDLGITMEELAELYSEFIKEMNFEISRLEELLIKKDSDEIKKALHNIKGISANYRITDIYEETAKIYDDFNSKKCDDIAVCIKNLSSISKSALQEITEYFSTKGLFL